MKQILSDIGDLITGKSNTPPNPAVQHNIKLLQEARQKIESGIFTKYFKRPYIVLMETIFYSLTIVFFGLAVIYFLFGLTQTSPIIDSAHALNNNIALFKEGSNLLNFEAFTNVLTQLQAFMDQFFQFILYLKLLLFVLMSLPSIFTFLLARSYTKSRRRLSKFIEVEAIIEKVIYNLGGK